MSGANARVHPHRAYTEKRGATVTEGDLARDTVIHFGAERKESAKREQSSVHVQEVRRNKKKKCIPNGKG